MDNMCVSSHSSWHPQPACFDKYNILLDWDQLVTQPVSVTGVTKSMPCVIISIGNSYKRSLAIYLKHRASCSCGRLLSVCI